MPLESYFEKEKIDIKKLAIEEPEKNPELRQLISREREAIEKFFGKPIEVPPLSEEITPERYQEWKEKGLELHYLPPIEFKDEDNYPGWKKKLGRRYASAGIDFFEDIKNGNLSPDSAKLPGSWALISEGRFFNVSWDAIHQSRFMEDLAKNLKVKPEQLRLPRAIEWNYLGNAFYPKWDDTDTWEWFEDAYQKGRGRLRGGTSNFGGLSYVNWIESDRLDSSIGFRQLVAFPKTESKKSFETTPPLPEKRKF